MTKPHKIYAALLLAAGSLVLFFAAFWLHQKKQCETMRAAEASISAYALRITHVGINDEKTEFTGRLTNESAHPIYGFDLEVTAMDCIDNACTKLGSHSFAIETLVPAGEFKEFTTARQPGNPLASLPKKDTLSFQIRAAQPMLAPADQWLRCRGNS